MSQKPVPPIDPWTAPYWTAAREHRLLIQRCTVCGKHIFYPRRSCPFCFADEVAWVEASGRGQIVAFSVVQNNAPSAFAADMPFVIAIVRLEEGVQMMTNIVECELDALHSEMPVTVTFEQLTETVTLPKFKPLTAP
ncbi:MAG: OB-fold domain-containing protein [Caldilineales bacterium]|nr:OB-fold domain-containing protein [Caldilineales bacterium]MCW5857470.1 OB-fold domain-containing protein [Caldilineales bacterium]